MLYLTEDSTGFNFPWESLEGLIRGVSSIDLSTVPIHNREDAYQFVLHYGYDLREPSDIEEIQSYFEDAVGFIERHFLTDLVDWAQEGEVPPPSSQIPSHLKDENLDLLDLILIAAQGEVPDRHWACAILKVMHTIAHIQNGPFYQYFDVARKQILALFEDILTPLKDGKDGVLLGKPSEGMTLRLYGFEKKDQKTRDSILMKLLCKKEHVAEAIWDLIGVRFITYSPVDALLALHILQEHKIIVFPNIIPSRSRNTMIDLDHFRKQYEALLKELKKTGPTGESELEMLFRQIQVLPPAEKNFTAHNPASSQHYRSIHITCRHLIRLKLPDGTETRFFFPYEIQILDQESYLESKDGASAHNLYKRKQLASARRRVLGKLLK